MNDDEAKAYALRVQKRWSSTAKMGEDPITHAQVLVEWILAKLEAERWVPVTERLPEELSSVMVWIPATGGPEFGGDACLAYFNNLGEWRTLGQCELLDGITHWRPLPEGPK